MISSTVENRSAARLQLLLAEEQVETAPQYARRDVTGDGKPETWCNLFARNIARRMGVPLAGARANDMVAWLASDPARAVGWEQVDEHIAQRMADEGQFAVACWFNRNGGPGHIAVVAPSLGEDGVWIAQAGSHSFTRAPVTAGFGTLPVTFFAHP